MMTTVLMREGGEFAVPYKAHQPSSCFYVLQYQQLQG